MEITPFYIGQRVVSLVTDRDLVKDKIYTINGILPCKCDGGQVSIGEPSNEGNVKIECWGCGQQRMSNGRVWWFAKNFAPLQQTKFPLMTFEKIKESSPEILIPN